MDEYKVQGESLVLSLFQESFALQTNKKRKLQFFLQTLPFEDLFCIRIPVEIFLFLVGGGNASLDGGKVSGLKCRDRTKAHLNTVVDILPKTAILTEQKRVLTTNTFDKQVD